MFLSLWLIDFVFSVHNDGFCAFIFFFENNFSVVNKLLESSSLVRWQIIFRFNLSGVSASFIFLLLLSKSQEQLTVESVESNWISREMDVAQYFCHDKYIEGASFLQIG